MTEKELMLSGNLYIAQGEELANDNRKARRLTRLINSMTEEQSEERLNLYRNCSEAWERNSGSNRLFGQTMAAILISEKIFTQTMTVLS